MESMIVALAYIAACIFIGVVVLIFLYRLWWIAKRVYYEPPHLKEEILQELKRINNDNYNMNIKDQENI